MQNASRLCLCARCGDRGRHVSEATYFAHRQRYGTSSHPRRPSPPISVPSKRPRATEHAAQLSQDLESMFEEFNKSRTEPSSTLEASEGTALSHRLADEEELIWEDTQTVEGNMSDDEDDWISWDDGEEEHEEEEEEEGSDFHFDFEESDSSDGGEEDRELALPLTQSGPDSWQYKVYLLIRFMMAFMRLSKECARLILTFVFCVLAPWIDGASTEASGAPRVPQEPRLVTASAVARSLGLKDTFTRYLVCPKESCSRLIPWGGKIPSSGTLYCPYCGTKTMCNRKPISQYTHRTVEQSLALLLQDERFENALEEWKAESIQGAASETHRYGKVWTGEAWRQDCAVFNCNTPCEHGHTPFVDDGDLNLKLTLNIDWFGPHHGRHTGWHSTGAILFRIDNLAERFSTLDRRCRGIHLVGLVPGPKEPKKEPLIPYLKLFIDELIDLDKNGRLIPTAKRPEGRRVRARLNMVVADSPARAKALDFTGNRTTGKFCPYCPKDMANVGTREPWEEGPQDSRPPPPTPETGARCKDTAVKRLKYFDLVLQSPVDPMHAVHGGMCERFWFNFLIEGCSALGGQRKEAQEIIGNAMLPSKVKMPDKRFGDKGSGSPTAEQWVTFYRCLLPFIMLSLWQRSLCGPRDACLRFQPTVKSRTREVKLGLKHVKDIFPIAMLLCCIVELLEGDMDDVDIAQLQQDINHYNVQLGALLGVGFLTYNNHLSEHIPEAVRRFGAARNFSCLPFERFNGKLVKINTSGHKQGVLERTIMKGLTEQQEVRHMLAQSQDSFLHGQILKTILSPSEQEEGTKVTIMAKTEVDDDTFRLLLLYLNGTTREFPGRFKVSHDPSMSMGDVPVVPTAQFIRTLIFESYPSETRVVSKGSARNNSFGNTFAVVRMPNRDTVAAQILWVFEKEIQYGGRGTVATSEKFMHIRKLKMLTVDEVMHREMDREMPHKELIARMKMSFASKSDDGEEVVVPVSNFVSQLAVVPFGVELSAHYHNPTIVYGLKPL